MTAESAGGTSPPAGPDPLDAFDLTESERAELLAALQRIVRHFVDLAFEGDGLLCSLSSQHHSSVRERERSAASDSSQKGDY
jgi:hypothetical protein